MASTTTPLPEPDDHQSGALIADRQAQQASRAATPQPPRGFGTLARRAAPLLNRQCWCWGCDVRRSSGNVLLEHGFRRRRVPPGALGSSAYTLELASAAVVLWGFGVFWGEPALGGVFLPRMGFAPRLLDSAAPPSDAWDAGQLATAAPGCAHEWTRTCRLLAGALQWVARYETWVCVTCGDAYRAACVAGWRKHVRPAHEMPAVWTELADTCRVLGCHATTSTQ